MENDYEGSGARGSATRTWTDLWAACTERLGSSDDARRIIEQVSGRVGAPWFITLSTEAPASAAAQVDAMVARRLAGEPLQYVLGSWGFRQLDLQVDPRVLIPRPETEQVVQAAIDAIDTLSSPLAVDLGTGSGAIALSIALEVHESRVVATDASSDALDVAMDNAKRLPATAGARLRFLQGSWYDALPDDLRGHVDLVISNPPYIAEADRHRVDQQVHDWEPHSALYAGPDGLDDIDVIIPQAMSWLSERGTLVVEIAPEQAPAVERAAWKAGFFSVEIGVDLAGRKRWLVAHRAG